MAIYKFKICNFVKKYFYSIEFLHLHVQHVIMSMQSIRLFQQILWDEMISPGNSQCMNSLGTYQIQLSIRVAEKWLNQVQNAVVLLQVFFLHQTSCKCSTCIMSTRMQRIRLFQQILWDELISKLGAYKIQISRITFRGSLDPLFTYNNKIPSV